MGQERYAERRQWTPMGNKNKRRNKAKVLDQRVEVVHLRTVTASSDGATDTTQAGSRYTCQWWVRPFFRWQPYGPGRSERKLILVDGHLKGPKDKPFRKTDRVVALDR